MRTHENQITYGVSDNEIHCSTPTGYGYGALVFIQFAVYFLTLSWLLSRRELIKFFSRLAERQSKILLLIRIE